MSVKNVKLESGEVISEEFYNKLKSITKTRPKAVIEFIMKNLRKYLDRTTRKSILQSLSKTKHIGLSLRKAAKLLAINRTSQYYHPKESAPSDEESGNEN